jgi:hypothetical protein
VQRASSFPFPQFNAFTKYFVPGSPRDQFSRFSRFALFRILGDSAAVVLNAPLSLRLCYPYEEFADHMKAMRTVREWEYTSRFGHLGTEQTSRANSARVVEYFFDSYIDKKEAVHKAELFLSIYDYIGRNQELFSQKGLMEKLNSGPLSVETALLRAIHHVFTVIPRPGEAEPKKVLALAKAFQDIQTV